MTGHDELTTQGYDRFIQRLTRRLRIKISGLLGGGDDAEPYPYAHRLAHLPDLVGLVADLAVDDRVPEARRRLLVAALVYVMSTGDLLPEAVIGPVGMADDLVVVAQTLEAVLRAGPADLALGLWQGEGELEAVVQGVLADGEAMVGPTVWSRLPGWFEAT
jgi:uncharacterized membrane protein YkvA (DUF1232 family)